ncbi:hypothetical protein [Rufibacter sp. LB8]|uniref:hypothetical protein n=1 Tax=Rufibacter sp. LB8 TaxID=2777781 RepID=UPI00178C3E97|nr:hypothetical protein [Rufibacter sp. LB8]
MKKPFLLFVLLALPVTFSLSSYALRVANTLVLLGKLPSLVEESSGLELADQPNTYWTHNDAGNEAVLYKINEKGKLLSQLQVNGTENKDWEDLAQDTKGFLYIGDMGDNGNRRKDLRIYKMSMKNGNRVQVLNFTYADKPKGKIEKEARNFDCEAFFWHANHLYLISKDRGQSKTAKLYSLPDTPGTHVAKLLAKKDFPGQVTSADLSPDGRNLAVLTFGKVYLYPVAAGSTQFFSKAPKVLELPRSGQVEAVVFKNNKTLIISNEEGSLYRYSL